MNKSPNPASNASYDNSYLGIAFKVIMQTAKVGNLGYRLLCHLAYGMAYALSATAIYSCIAIEEIKAFAKKQNSKSDVTA